jgi:hypothetical protein
MSPSSGTANTGIIYKFNWFIYKGWAPYSFIAQRMNIMKKSIANYYRYNRIRAKINP